MNLLAVVRLDTDKNKFSLMYVCMYVCMYSDFSVYQSRLNNSVSGRATVVCVCM